MLMALLPSRASALARTSSRLWTAPPTSLPRIMGRVDSARLRGIPTLIAILVTAAIAAVAITELRHSPRHPTSTGAIAGRQQLISMLGLLRRPQIAQDLPPELRSALQGHRGPGIAALGTPDLPLVRYATTTPWGEKLYLVPTRPLSAAQVARLRQRYRLPEGFFTRNGRPREALFVWGSEGGNLGGYLGPPAGIRKAGFWNTPTHGPGAPPAVPRAPATVTRFFIVVPDGVARVVFLLPREAFPNQPGTPVYPHSLRLPVTVHGNIAVFQIDRQCCEGTPTMLWYASDGHIIRRIGHTLFRPRPGPETALSRAAERNPAAPNPVSVTPLTGGPHANFKVNFRVLLNHTGYRYTITGPRCRRFRFSKGGTGLNYFRGYWWSNPIGAVPGQALCPGTYRISVTAVRLTARPPTHFAKPFGTATFTVRR